MEAAVLVPVITIDFVAMLEPMEMVPRTNTAGHFRRLQSYHMKGYFGAPALNCITIGCERRRLVKATVKNFERGTKRIQAAS